MFHVKQGDALEDLLSPHRVRHAPSLNCLPNTVDHTSRPHTRRRPLSTNPADNYRRASIGNHLNPVTHTPSPHRTRRRSVDNEFESAIGAELRHSKAESVPPSPPITCRRHSVGGHPGPGDSDATSVPCPPLTNHPAVTLKQVTRTHTRAAPTADH